jgi:hypothetical protein
VTNDLVVLPALLEFHHGQAFLLVSSQDIDVPGLAG